MKRNFLNKLLLVVLALSVFSCKTRQVAGTVSSPKETVVETPASSATAVLHSINAGQTNFSTLGVKAKADLTIAGNKNDVNMNIRIKNNEALWVSITALAGIEVARALVTPDSIKVLNRLQSEYIRKPFSYIQQFSNEKIDFKTVQALFVGNAIPGVFDGEPHVDLLEGQTQVSGDLSGLLYHFIFNPEYDLVQTNLKDGKEGRSLMVDYSNFKPVAGQSLPHTVVINSSSAGKGIILDMKYHQINLNEPVEFPFNVPKRFTVKD